MPNTYFQFKQFRIEQDRCALKVCTDACLFGAWTAEKLKHESTRAKTVLDIGSGTGLLMLMLAQQSTAHITGVEIDQASFEQSVENISHSSWKERLNIVYADICGYEPMHQYDLIISNPPFFENDLRSPNLHKNISKHDAGLTLSALIEQVVRLLKEDGRFAVLLPYNRTDEFLELAQRKDLWPHDIITLSHTHQHPPFRTMLLMARKPQKQILESAIVIHDEEGTYSPKAYALLKDYYLYL
jgi:tRNA1Val (adenine37-N6)-methyltransferase